MTESAEGLRPSLARRNVPPGKSRDAWVAAMGCSEGVRVGNLVWVGATVGTDEHGEYHTADLEEQTDLAIRNLAATLARLGAGLEHVVMTRVYTVDIGRRDHIARAHRKHFEGTAPATCIVEVLQLHSPFALVALEATAVVPAPPPA